MHFSGENGCQLCFLQGTNLWLPWPGNSFSLSLTLSLSFLAQPSMPEFAWAGRWLPAARGNTVCFHFFFKLDVGIFFRPFIFILQNIRGFFSATLRPARKPCCRLSNIQLYHGQDKKNAKRKRSLDIRIAVVVAAEFSEFTPMTGTSQAVKPPWPHFKADLMS